ncbi:MAG: cysteine desulfurase [Deltaproteobacteria bacterium]|nr:cysteine desulfurase [Deltaproteobacteria bacterium]
MKVYLDNNATTPVDPRVAEIIQTCLTKYFGNPASAGHAWGWEAEELVNIARENVAELIQRDSKDTIFTSGATESINLALRGIKKKHKRVIYSSIEHKAVLDCIAQLEREGIECVRLGVNREGFLNLTELQESLKSPADLVSIIAANNEIGTIQDLEIIGEICAQSGALLHLDLSQLIGKVKIDYKSLHFDLASISAHKFYGPKGAGALYISPKLKAELTPLIFGGGHEHGIRAGTLNTPGIVGFGKAAEIIRSEIDQILSETESLTSLFDSLMSKAIEDIILNGPSSNRICGNLNYALPGIRADKLISKLAKDIAISSSSACMSHLSEESHVLSAIGLDKELRNSCIRIGIGRFNSEEEIRFAADKIIEAYQSLTQSSN